jgi:hypothetical protein
MIVVHAQFHLSEDLVEQSPADGASAMIGDHDDATVRAAEGVVAPITPRPSKTRGLGHAGKVAISGKSRLGHAAALICQVSTKSVSAGASGSATLR